MAVSTVDRTLVESIVFTFKRFQFGTKLQLAFLEDLYTLINDGIPANRAVEMLSNVCVGVSKEVALSILRKIAEGQPLAEGMKDWFTPNVVELVRIGELGGALAQTLKSAINMLSQRGVAMGSFLSAILYPMFVAMMACVLIIYLDSGVFEQFRMIKPEERWPAAGKRLVALSVLVKQWWWLFFVIIGATILAMRWLMANYTGALRPILDRYPPFLFYRRLVAARMLETLGLLVANGVVFKSALKTMNLAATPYLHYHLDHMELLLSTGKSNIADVLETGLVSDQDLMRLRVMAEVKGFEQGLVRMGILGAEQATATLKTISRVVGGLFLMLDAVLVMMILQGLFLTAQSMGQA